MNIKKIILGTITGVGMLLATMAPAFAAGTWYVGPTGNDTNNCLSAATACLTIQGAVDKATAGDTVIVAAGNYPENVNISKALTLEGPNQGIGGNGTRNAEATVSSINITASNVTVDGFTFTNTGGDQINLDNATLLSGIRIQNNIFTGYDSVGIPTTNAGDILITKNLFDNPGSSAEPMQFKATQVGGCDGTTVSDNTFTGATTNGSAEINFSCGNGLSSNITVSGNTDSGLTGGTSFVAISGITNGISITDNRVSDNTANAGSAIFFWGSVSGTASISGNTITNAGSSAVSIHGGDLGNGTTDTGTFTVTNNTLTGNVRGVFVASTALSTGAKVNVNNNDLSGNTTEGIENDATAFTVDGTCNWWGDASGPGSIGPGTGANVTNNVTYTPWLTSSDLTGTCGGGLVNVTIVKYLDGSLATAASANSASFPMFAAWSATNIGTGTGNYSLNSTGYNNPNPYEATTSEMTSGANYSTVEVTHDVDNTSNVLPVGAACQMGMTRLVGYSYGNTLADAEYATTSSTPPDFTNLTSNKYVIVRNESCIAPTTFAQCRGKGWKSFNTPSFKNEGYCVAYVATHMHTVNGDVTFSGNNHSLFWMNTAINRGSLFYYDSSFNWFKVDISDVKVNGNRAYYAGEITNAKSHALVGQWLFGEVEDNSPDMIWGQITDKSTAMSGVNSMSDPAGGASTVTQGNVSIH